ncbi:putative Transcription factor HBP-1b(c1) [Hordeum vulgare]|nr:putative Transcription factor HBP-1b(c1) [Hordeum vulgare]
MDYGTDASTDPDVDKNQEQEPFEQGHAVLIAPSDPSGKTNGKLGPKTLRRLAQNREAARRSRLRKKAYVQQLESSSLKLAQLEQELRRARQQGFLSTLGDQADSENGANYKPPSLSRYFFLYFMLKKSAVSWSPTASSFYVEYGRWLEGQLQKVEELRAAVSSHADDSDLQAIVDTIIARWDEIFTLKGAAAKADAFHVLSGAWTTPVERFFLWLGGFRPSEFLKLLASRLEPLTEKQLDSIGVLRHSSLQAEGALSTEMEALRQSVAEAVAAAGPSFLSCSAAYSDDGTGEMAAAVAKLGALEGLLRQGDDLRLRILEETRRVLTTRQCARAVLVVSDYFSRMRALSSL